MNIIKEKLQEKNISIYQMAKETKIPYSTLNDIVNQKIPLANTKYTIGLKIANYLCIDPFHLEAMSRDVTVSYTDCFGNKYLGIIEKDKKNFLFLFWILTNKNKRN